MKSSRTALLALAACAALTTPVSAQDTILDRLVKKIVKPASKPPAPSAAPVKRAGLISQLDVAGVRLGMTPAQARAALLQSGYKVTEDRYRINRTWEELVQVAVAQRLGKYGVQVPETGGRNLEGTKDRRQTIEVHFVAKPEGMRVGYVEYRIPGEEITKDDYDANVLAKYGRPDVNHWGSMAMIWCSVGEPRCAPLTQLKRPHLESRFASSIQVRILELNGVDQAEEARRQALIAAEVERRAPRTRQTAF